MADKFNVFHYVTFTIKKSDIEAETAMDAVQQSIDAAWETAHSIGSEWGDVDFAEESTGALVDVVGDEEYTQSITFSQEEIYDHGT